MRVAIHQPNFIPWLGYFHKLMSCDVFIFLDDVQLPRGKSFVSRVAIKSPPGESWLTVPVKGKGDLISIKDALLAEDQDWRRKHLRTLETCYAKAPYYKEAIPLLRQVYQSANNNLADFNIGLISSLVKFFTAPVHLVRSSELKVSFSDPLDHLVKLTKYVGGSEYLTGTGEGSRRYLDEPAFSTEGIQVFSQSFKHPEYPQLWGEFIPNLSVIDLIFNCGSAAKEILLSQP